MESHIAGQQFRTFDASMLITYSQAHLGGDAKVEEFLYQRLRPAARKATDAWLKTDPFKNPSAPPSPLDVASDPGLPVVKGQLP